MILLALAVLGVAAAGGGRKEKRRNDVIAAGLARAPDWTGQVNLVDGVATAAAGPQRTRPKRKPLFFLQFHKAGGSSFCALFHHAGLRTHDTHAGVRRPGHAHCNCKSKLLGNLSSPEGPRLMMAEMARRNLDVCMMEESWKFPAADALRRFAIQWRALGGEIATTIRDPWARFESTFLREHGTSVHKGYGNLTIQQFAQPDFREHPAGREAAKYGAFNRPNFYVRLLNGLDGRGGGKDRHGAKHGVGPEASIGPRELQRALDALAQFDHVFLLDGDLQAAARKELMGRDTSMPRASNSHYSSENLRLHPERVALLPETKSYRTRFALENCADRALYAAVQRQVRLAGTCRGCTPEDFFLAAEKSPRPRCLSIREAHAYPALWASLQNFWDLRGAKVAKAGA